MFTRLVCILLLTAPALYAQIPFALVEIDEIGHLGTSLDERDSIELGLAKAFSGRDESIRLEGLDDKALPWRVWLPKCCGIVGETRVFQADLDANGRTDLLITSMAMGNGRCVGGGTVTTLMFDSTGRPVPWRSLTVGMIEHEEMPVTLVDLDRDGRAEIVTSACAYAQREDVGMAEDRWISGVYEARDTKWAPLKPLSVEPYLQAVKPRYSTFAPGYPEWIKSPEPLSPDPLEGWAERPRTKLTALLSAEMGCRTLAYAQASREKQEDGCTDQATTNRVHYADGSVRSGWPYVVFDTLAGREIFLFGIRDALARVLSSGFEVEIIGSDVAPAFLWASAAVSTMERPVSLRVAMRVIERGEIKLAAPTEAAAPDPNAPKLLAESGAGGGAAFTGGSPAPLAPQAGDPPSAGSLASFIIGLPRGSPLPEAKQRAGRFLSREGSCFYMPNDRADQTVEKLDGCAGLAPLESLALGGDRVLIGSYDTGSITISPTERTHAARNGFRGDDRISRQINFQPVAGRYGNLIGAVYVEPFWLAQWEDGSRQWFAIHNTDGAPESEAFEAGLTGELLSGDRYRGLNFLRWAGGVPVESLKATLTLEWVAAE